MCSSDLAARHIDGPLLILAGAGSGKTATITYTAIDIENAGINIVDISDSQEAAEDGDGRHQADGASGLASLGQGIVVEPRGDGCGRSWDVEQDRRDGASVNAADEDSADQGKGVVETPREREGDQHSLDRKSVV